MFGNERMRAEVLTAYIGGADLDPKHSCYVIQELFNLGYLRSGIDMSTEK